MMKLNAVNIRQVLEADKQIVEANAGLTVRFYPVGYPNRKPTERYGAMKNHFKRESLRTDFTDKVHPSTFVDALNNGYTHMVTDAKGVQSLVTEFYEDKQRKKAKNGVFRSNIMVFDIDCKYKEDGTPKQPKVLEAVNRLGGVFKFEEELQKHFHILQRSCSWELGETVSPSYHGYIFLAEDINNIKDYQTAYKYVVTKLIEALDIEFDPSIDPLKMICAGKTGYGNLVENRNKPKLILPQDLYINKTEEDIARDSKTKKITTIDKDLFKRSLSNHKATVLDDYEAWWKTICSLANAVKEGLLNEEEALEVLEAIDDGNGEYLRLFEYYSTKDYDDINFGTALHHLRKLGVDTSGIISSSYEESPLEGLSNVERYKFSGKLSNNPQIVGLIDSLLDEKGTRSLVYAPTNAGKTTLFMKAIHERHEKRKGFKAVITTRKKLRENLSEGFIGKPHCLSVDGTQLQDGEVSESQVMEAYNFVTTYDNAPKLFSMISPKLDIESDNLLIVDEAHMLASDTGFKADRVKKFLDFEEAVIKSTNTISIHTTATIDDMDLKGYDRIILLESEDPTLPFVKAEYRQFPQGVNKVDTFLKELKIYDGKLLVFIENKDIIRDYAKALREEGKNVVTITSESDMNEDAINNQEVLERISIIKKGVVPAEVDTILATSTIGAGVSIIETSEAWETWILSIQESPNGNPTSIRQYANRLRNRYNKLVLFVHNIKETSSSNEYPLHKKVEEHLMEANIMVGKYGRKYDTTRYFKLSVDEARNGLYQTSDGTVVFKEKVYSYHLAERTKYNINNPLCLINALSRHYGVEFTKGRYVMGLTEQEQIEAKQRKEASKEEAEAYVAEFIADTDKLEDLVAKKDKSAHFTTFLQDVSIINRKKVKSVKALIFSCLVAEDFKTAFPNVMNSKTSFSDDLRTYKILEDGNYKTLNEVVLEINRSAWKNEELTKAELEAKIEEVINSLELGTDNLKPLTVSQVRKCFDTIVSQARVQGKKAKVYKLNRLIDRHTLIERYGFDPTYGFGDIRVVEFIEQDLEDCPFI